MKHIVLIPIYNDWKSLEKLISKLDFYLTRVKKISNEILIINDNSSKKPDINCKNLKTIKKIKILFLKKNLGSQKAIAIGLDYLKKDKKDFFVTIMDSDGEDNPREVPKMLNSAINHPNYVVTSNRKRREEPYLIIILYKLHLLFTFIFTWKWISFGNFTTFNKKNIKNLFSDNSSWYAHSASVIKNCNFIRLYAKREKRYFGKSNLGLFALIEHSLRINVVFFKTIFISSCLYLLVVFLFLNHEIKDLINYSIIVFNLLIIITKLKHKIVKFSNISAYIVKTKLI